MTESSVPTAIPPETAEPGQERRGRRRRIILLLILLGLTATLLVLSVLYLTTRKPLTDVLPVLTQDTPAYAFSIYGVDAPYGIAVDPDGSRIYVTETDGQYLVKTFDASGNLVARSSAPNTAVGSRVPVYAARDPKTGEVYVTDRSARVIDVYSPGGAYDRTLPVPDGVDAAEWEPLGLAFDADGVLYVGDVGSKPQRVVVIDRTGKLTRTIDGAGELSFPNGLITDGPTVLAADGNNGRLVAMSEADPLKVLVGMGAAKGNLGLPRGLATGDHDRLFVVDSVSSTVNVYRLGSQGESATYLSTFGVEGRGDAQFEYPHGIATDGRGHVYVADTLNNRIQVWSY
jgi:DNA-binding beta-propeller fold protein YncE